MDGAARAIRRGGSLLIQSFRLLIGGILIFIGCLGVVLPILPGMPFFILGSLVIGRRSRPFRQASIAGKRFLKRWSAHQRPWLARTGRWSLLAQRDTSRRLRRLLWWWQTRQRQIVQRVRGSAI
jgi:hypothetical protein